MAKKELYKFMYLTEDEILNMTSKQFSKLKGGKLIMVRGKNKNKQIKNKIKEELNMKNVYSMNFYDVPTKNTIEQQIVKIREELIETQIELNILNNLEGINNATANLTKVYEEANDLMQVVFTLMLIIAEDREAEVIVENNNHIEKMIRRYEKGGE